MGCRIAGRCISGQLEFERFDGRRVVAAFDGGAVTSDAGALLLRETDRAIRLIERVAACFSDGRDPGQLIHALPTLVGLRYDDDRRGLRRPASAMRIEAPNALDRLTYDVDENRIDGFSEDDLVRSQSAAWDSAPELWAVPVSAGEFPIEAARFTGLDLRGYQQMRLVLNVGGQAGLTGTILYYRYSLDGGATWYDTDAAIQLDGSANEAFWGNWQPIPPMLRQSIDTTVALFGKLGDGATLVELVDWFVLDIRGVDHTSAARLLPPQVTPAEIANPTGTELRSFSPKDIADIFATLIP